MPKDDVYNEKELLQLLAAGDEHAFRRLFDAFRDKIYFYIFRMTESRQTAEDVLQDVFLKLWQERTQLHKIDNLNAWIYRLALNRTINGMKRVARETLILAELGRPINTPDVPATDDRLIQLELKKMLDLAVEKLPAQQKKVFHLSRVEGLKHKEIASQLNISPFTVKKHMQQALHFIREQFNSHYHISPLIIYVVYKITGK